MASEFASCVGYGLNLSKRIYYGKGSVPPLPLGMSRSSLPEDFLPVGPMVYAVVREPVIVENPDIRSYQPYVHGRCEPPALIPLHMHGIAMEIECCLNTAFVTVSGTWRVHCVAGSRTCDCRIAIPMGDQGSVLGVEVDVTGSSFHTQLITMEDVKNMGKEAKVEDGCFIKRQIYTFNVPRVGGGSMLSVKLRWSQKLSYNDGQFCLNVPFSFPEYVNPVGKKISKKEKILLNVNSGTGEQILCKSSSHPLKEVNRQSCKLGFLYEAEVPTWSGVEFNFSYAVSSSDLFGGVLLQSPCLHDFDQRDILCLYLFPGNNQSRKAFRKEVVFVVDISRSMKGDPLENAKNALLASLAKLNPLDLFNIIAFNGEVNIFSSSMELATKGAILNATEWVSVNFIANGGTSILPPLKQAIKLLSETTDAVPLIFLITDGSVDEEREICNVMSGYLANGGTICPRIYTIGIGSYCNHYFLQMLAEIGRGYYDDAYNTESIDFRIQRLFRIATSVILANITMDTLEQLNSLEFFPSHLPDFSSSSPMIVSGRYDGEFPSSVKVRGILADMSNFTIDLKVQTAKDLPLDRVLARKEIDILTSHAWLSESKELEEKVEKMSLQTGVPSEYTRIILNRTDKRKKDPELVLLQQKVGNKLSQVGNKFSQLTSDIDCPKTIFLGSIGIGFGNLTATAENIPPGTEETKSSEATEMLVKAASNLCGKALDRCCCMCFIQSCSYMNDRCTILLTQLCAALACFQCFSCCFEICECL